MARGAQVVSVTQPGPADPVAEAAAVADLVRWVRPRLAAELGAPPGTIGERGKVHATKCRGCGEWRRASTEAGLPTRAHVICGAPACIAWLDGYEAELRAGARRAA